MSVKQLIPLSYSFTFGNHDEDDPFNGSDNIAICGKAYSDFFEQYADGPNGEDGVLYEDAEEGEPYAYYCEIADIMGELGFVEASEGCFEPIDTMYIDRDKLKRDFLDRGYELIEEDVDDSMLK